MQLLLCQDKGVREWKTIIYVYTITGIYVFVDCIRQKEGISQLLVHSQKS